MSTAVECARCFKPTRATALEKVRYAGVDYELDLCERHATDLQRDMNSWLRVAREVNPFNELQVHTEQWRRVHSLESNKPALVAPRVPAEGAMEAVSSPAHELFGGWVMSDHAIVRQHERHFTEDEIALAVVAPDEVTPAYGHETRRLQRRGRLTAVTDPSEKVVVTLLFRNHDEYLDYLNDLPSLSKEPVAQ